MSPVNYGDRGYNLWDVPGSSVHKPTGGWRFLSVTEVVTKPRRMP
jgi:hypothetical protein